MVLRPIIPRPALYAWMRDRGITLDEAAGELQCTREWVRRICLPFADPSRGVPSAELEAKVREWTAGEVASFEPPAERAA